MANKRPSTSDRRRVAGNDEYEVEYFAQKYGLLADQVEDLIQQYGHQRARLDAAVMRLPD
jgi:hypothetical protein